MNSKILKQFKKPSSEYRGAPFWAWNGKLDPNELRRQVRVMHRMGLGGFFMHSRVGLDTPYLSKEWMDCVEACVDEADKLDMKAWLYDEDRWPSGAAGGLVTKNPKYRQRHLICSRLTKPSELKWGKDTLGAFTARIIGGKATEVTPVPKGRRPKALEPGTILFAFSVRVNPCTSWHNGYTYLDTMNHAAVREFIRVTHDAYRKRFSKAFGKRIPGIFTDEPNYGKHGSWFHRKDASEAECAIPWTERLPAVFRKRYGYDLADHFMALFFDVEGDQGLTARVNYYDCITYLFCDAFGRLIGEWCDRNGMEHTGHVLEEPTLISQTNVVGSAMRFYEFMQAPGMDLLTEYNREYDTAKQVSSAARQFGRRWRLTETYGCTGWDFNFEGHKALGDWQAALGINLRCQHLSWYTMLGEAKRDYPAGIFYQSPWWEVYPKVEDYFARIHVLMSHGKEVRDLLVIHPIESMWALMYRYGNDDRQKLQDCFWRLRDTLLAANIDFDYGEEDILARHARVKRKGDTHVLAVGKAEYRAVVVPPMLTLRSSTLSLLSRFREAGGQVVFAGKPAPLVDAMPNRAAIALAKACARTRADGKSVTDAVESSARRVSITDEKGREIRAALHQLREDKDAFYLFICNTGHDNIGKRYGEARVRDRKLTLPQVNVLVVGEGNGKPLELDPNNGEVLWADGEREGDGWRIRTSLARVGSRLFVLPKKDLGIDVGTPRKLGEIRSEPLPAGKWEIRLSETNCVVLDQPEYRIGKGAWDKALEILQVDREVRKSLGIQHRGGQMVQPWAQERKPKPKSVDVGLRYAFEARDVPSGEVHLAVERPDKFRIRLNGVEVSTDAECGWWCDLALRRVPLPNALICAGANELLLECRYDEYFSGFELCYLLGDFGVEVNGRTSCLVTAPSRLNLGDWTVQGLPFYSGSVAYRRTLKPVLGESERLFIRIGEYCGTAVRVLVNGRIAGVLAWEPHEVDITDLIDGEKAELAIEVIGHRRNSHGPHHLSEKWPRWTGPAQFVTRGDRWVDDYQLVPCGLTKAPKLIWKR